MSNKDLLKQAIAEAKTIREAAIANAKEALEETLTPHLKEMLAQKLQEMEDSEEETVDETVNNSEEQDYSENPNTHGNLEEAEEEGEEEETGETEEGEEETEEGEEEDIDVKDMSVDELKDLIRDIVSQEVGHDESEEEMPEETPEGEEDMVSMDGDSEEIDLNELLAELAEMDKEDNMEEGFEDWIDKTSKKMEKFGKNNKFIQGVDKGINKAQQAKERLLGKSPLGANHPLSEENLEEGFEDWLNNVSAKLEKFGKNNPAIQGIEKAIASAQASAKKAGIAGGGWNKGNHLEESSEDLNEALATVKHLRTQLQEVNLLNAKLLYVNKVFKANNLTESQKVNVVAAFDKAETVKEVKLVFETVSKNVVTKPVAIKEHKSFASKPTGTAPTVGKKEIISEVSEQVARWQKLAGIIKS